MKQIQNETPTLRQKSTRASAGRSVNISTAMRTTALSSILAITFLVGCTSAPEPRPGRVQAASGLVVISLTGEYDTQRERIYVDDRFVGNFPEQRVLELSLPVGARRIRVDGEMKRGEWTVVPFEQELYIVGDGTTQYLHVRLRIADANGKLED